MNTLRRSTTFFAMFAAGAGLLSAAVVRALVELARRDDTSSHVVLIPLIVAALLYHERDSIFAAVQPARRSGAAIIVLGAMAMLGAERFSPTGLHGGALTIAVAGLLVAWVGGFLWFYGWRSLRAACFPLLFLLFTIPIPGPIVDAMTLFLKTGSRDAVAGLFSVTGTPFFQSGFTFALPNFAIEIADECSGIRSSIALVLTSLLVGHLFFRGPVTKTFLVLAVLPMAIVKNAIRIVTLTLLAMYVDPGFLTGRLHHEGGVVFYLIALAILAPFVVLLQRWEMSALDRGASES